MDTLVLSRIQFAANISFHILFPTINIALGWFLRVLPAAQQRGSRTPAAQGWDEAYFLWTKVFALSLRAGRGLAASP